MPALGIATDQKNDIYARHLVQNTLAPDICTTLHGRQVPALGVIARKAQAHGQYRHPGGVIELLPCHTHPVAQAITGWIVERHPGRIRQIARRLPRHEHFRRFRQLENGVWRALHLRFAQPALPHLRNQGLEIIAHLVIVERKYGQEKESSA